MVVALRVIIIAELKLYLGIRLSRLFGVFEGNITNTLCLDLVIAPH